MTSVINFINTGTGANAGNGDSLRTAFNKINRNFVALENSYVQSGVASFNGTGGIITFTATDIVNLLGFTPYDSANPNLYVTQAAVNGLASLSYLDSNFVTTSTILNYATRSYVNSNLAQYATLDFLANQNYVSNVTLPSFLTSYATQAYVGNNFVSTASIATYLNQGKTNLVPSMDDTYNIGTDFYRWKNLYLSDTLHLDGYSISVDNLTGVLLVNGQGVTGNFQFTPQQIYNNNVSFDISASYNSLTTPAAVAGLHFPNNAEAGSTSIRIYNTATGGVVLSGKTTQLLVDQGTAPGVEIRGNIKLPVTFSDGRRSTGNRLVINPDVIAISTANTRVAELDVPLSIVALNSGTSTIPVRMSIIGNEVAIFARGEGLTNVANVLSVTTSGVFIGSTNTGFVLPTAIGATGTTLISDGQGLVTWSTQTLGQSNINSQNAVFTTATITKHFRLGTDGLSFYDGSSMITAYGNQQVSDFLPQYSGALSVGYIAGLGTHVDIISNGLMWAFSATGVLSLPDGGQIGELYGNGVDIRANPAGYVKLVSNSGNNYIKTDNLGAYVFATNNLWAFGTDGTLSLPQCGAVGAAVIQPNDTTFGIKLISNGKIWAYGTDGSLTFPNNTVQTTAYTGTVAYSNITGAPASVNKTSGSWTLAPGANTVSITVAPGNNYQMWVNGNIPNGIVEWNATVNVSNTNVPAIGSQYAWYYAAGNALVLTSMPNQIVGTAGVISTATVVTTTSNVFRFGITNNSGSSQVINWGYTTL
jgi:hypothetical protein